MRESRPLSQTMDSGRPPTLRLWGSMLARSSATARYVSTAVRTRAWSFVVAGSSRSGTRRDSTRPQWPCRARSLSPDCSWACCSTKGRFRSGLPRRLIEAPQGYAARGYLDTNLYVFPAHELVVVRMQSRPVECIHEGVE